MTIFRGDNTAAFGGNFLEINITTNLPNIPIITKAELRIGYINKVFENPTFPLKVDLTEEETEQLSLMNTAYLAVWDAENRKKTCVGNISFKTIERRV